MVEDARCAPWSSPRRRAPRPGSCRGSTSGSRSRSRTGSPAPSRPPAPRQRPVSGRTAASHATKRRRRPTAAPRMRRTKSVSQPILLGDLSPRCRLAGRRSTVLRSAFDVVLVLRSALASRSAFAFKRLGWSCFRMVLWHGSRHFCVAASGSANTKIALPPLGRLISGASTIGMLVPQLAAPMPTGTATYWRPPTE